MSTAVVISYILAGVKVGLLIPWWWQNCVPELVEVMKDCNNVFTESEFPWCILVDEEQRMKADWIQLVKIRYCLCQFYWAL